MPDSVNHGGDVKLAEKILECVVVTPEETARQRKAYGALARRFEHTVIVDASRPVDMVVSDVAAAIIARLAEKTQRFLESRF